MKNILFANIPNNPGIYLMKDRMGKIIYIGKASNLKKRVSTYFTKDSSLRPRIERMVGKTKNIDYIATETEIDALILEANLIKLHKPEYNVKFRDDKKYPFIKVTLNEKFPRVFPTRIIKKNGSLYLGPYTDVKAVKKTIKTGRKIFPIRSCGKRLPVKACLDYHIGLCSAPCISLVSVDEYRKAVDNLTKFLDGRQTLLEKELEDLMNQLSVNLEFEKAKDIRDRLFALRKVQNRQKVVLPYKIDIDIIGLSSENGNFCAVVDEVRDGKLIYQHHYFLQGMTGSKETMETFITGYYRERNFFPREIIVCLIPRNREILEKWLNTKSKRKIKIIKKIKKGKLALLRMANKNAALFLNDFLTKKTWTKTSKEVMELMKSLKLKSLPIKMEAFDVSNIMGEYAVGSSVLFVNGKPKKSGYLHYRIRGVKGINDVAMIKEVITRRLNRIMKLNQERPDLLIVDGGEGQLNAAFSVIKDKGFEIPVISLAKKFENIHLIGKKIVSLPLDSIPLKLLKRIRDESHRFAIQYYRKLHKKELSSSLLDGLKGIGEIKKRELLKHFGSVARLRKATVEDIEKVKGFGNKTALKIWRYLNNKDELLNQNDKKS
ncbi:MAG: excinuclease ABC subunit UvrC [Candidatus Cloacimonadota bacterium]|nr:MAG: excinuclease ABC subunit UvrC [Candidatus Cloacimonadota bacterium]